MCAVEDEVRLDRSLDGLLDLGVGLVHQVANPAEDLSLPGGQGVDVGIDPRILDVRHGYHPPLVPGSPYGAHGMPM